MAAAAEAMRPVHDLTASHPVRRARDAVWLGLAVLVLSWIATRFGSGAGAGVAAVWPVDAVILVTLLRRPRRQWPVLVLAAVIGETASSFYPLANWRAQLGLALCDGLEATVAALALARLLGPGLDLSRRRDLSIFGLVALGASVVSGLPACVVFWLAHGSAPTDVLPNWILGDTLGLVIVAPALMAVQAGELKALFSTKGRARTFAVLGCEVAIVAGAYIYDEPLLKALIIVAMMLPAVELGMTGAAIGVFLGGAAMIGLASANPALVHASLKVIQRDIDVVQVFLAVAAVATLGLAATIADRRRLQALMQESVAKSEARYRRLADLATDIIVQLDEEGRATYVSPSVRTIGYAPEDIVGSDFGDLIHPDDLGDARRRMDELPQGHPIDELARPAMRVRRADGGWALLEGRPSPIRGPDGRPSGFQSQLRDITQRRAMEEELERKRYEAEAAAIAKTEFLANMSHEIRTPLTAIIGFAGLIDAMDDLPAPAAQYVDRIVTAGHTLLSVVNDILDLSKIEAGQLELDPQPFAPRAFIEETLELAAGQAECKGLSLTCDIGDDMPAAVLADSQRIRQVLLNLICNAVKFTDQGSVTVRADYQPSGPGQLLLTVTDTGLGIPADKLHRLFQRFSQVDGSISRTHGGTGLGLVICKTLTEMMGGQIGVDSVEGRGSTFRVAIPAPTADLAQVCAEPDDSEDEAPASRILIVDDLAVNRQLISAMLNLFGHTLTEACNGHEAVEAATRAPFDLILMDLHMPGMDGLAAARAIRAAGDINRATPIVALSANAMATHVADCVAAGMNDHIAKPIDPATLLTKVAYWTAAVGDSLQAELA